MYNKIMAIFALVIFFFGVYKFAVSGDEMVLKMYGAGSLAVICIMTIIKWFLPEQNLKL